MYNRWVVKVLHIRLHFSLNLGILLTLACIRAIVPLAHAIPAGSDPPVGPAMVQRGGFENSQPYWRG